MPRDPFQKMNFVGNFFFAIFCAIIDVLASICFIALFFTAAVGSIINSIGEGISALGQFLMKVDPLR